MIPMRSAHPGGQGPSWPDGKTFAFTVFDDTDCATVANCAPVYDFLKDSGFRTTKSVWPIRGREQPMVGGDTCEDPAYLRWVLSLQRHGFEIGLHNVTYHSSSREQTIRGLARFRELFGHNPVSFAHHAVCAENMYWGAGRTSGTARFIYNALTGFRRRRFEGHVPSSPLFWGDLCRQHVTYVRNFVFREINTLRVCPFMPYYDPARPLVRWWFAGTEGPDARSFARILSEENQDRLEREGGACIMYTHFGKSFWDGGKLYPPFRQMMERLSRKNGWFVPSGELLSYLRERNGGHTIADSERCQLERQWLMEKFRGGGTS